MNSPRYLVLGAGRQGRAAAYDLVRSGGTVTLVDTSQAALDAARLVPELASCTTLVRDFRDREQILPLLREADGAFFSADYSLNLSLTGWAIEARCHAVDLGGNHDVVAAQHDLHDTAASAGVAIVPDTGLTPGLAGVLVAGGIETLDSAHTARIRVGGLPQNPQPPLNYTLLFSVRGLINEYIEPSVLLVDGRKTTRPAMDGLETLRFGEDEYEAFWTSGGVSTLPESFGNILHELDCKTIRYPGHAALIRFAFSLGFGSPERVQIGDTLVSPREVFEHQLVASLPHDQPDVTLMRVWVEGMRANVPTTVEYEMVDRYDPATGLTSMQRTTAWPGTIILRMLVEGTIQDRGVLYQERAVHAKQMIARLADRGVRIQTTVLSNPFRG